MSVAAKENTLLALYLLFLPLHHRRVATILFNHSTVHSFGRRQLSLDVHHMFKMKTGVQQSYLLHRELMTNFLTSNFTTANLRVCICSLEGADREIIGGN